MRNHTCAQCGCEFIRKYNISARRAARPQLCSPECLSLFISSRKSEVSDRFWKLVKKSGQNECWPFVGHTREWGYGWFNGPTGPTNAHRVAYMLSKGPIPPGLFVCHSCDNPPCCNPSHLWVGTVGDNTRDMIKKGRSRQGAPRIGSANHNTKLTPDAVREIIASNDSPSRLAAKHGVTSAAIYNIRHGKAWRHITGLSRAS